ncbi:hypothetical protein AB1N83_005772 [Pleurotus pulmonarius]
MGLAFTTFREYQTDLYPSPCRRMSSTIFFSIPRFMAMPTVTSINFEDLKADDTIIAILGPTGAGKSSFINTSTRQYSRSVGHSLSPCTMQMEAVRYRDNNEDIVFVDTPGCDASIAPGADGLCFVTSRLERMNFVLAGIIYVHRITDNRPVGVARNLKSCKILYKKGVVRHVTFITTMWTELEEVEGKQREEHLLKHFWAPIFRLKSSLIRFKGTAESAWDIIHIIVAEARAQLQRERVGRRLLSLIRLTQSRQIKTEGDATLNKELDRVQDLINQSMMQIQGIKIPISSRLKHLLLLKIRMKLGLTPIKTQPTFTPEQATASRSTVHISDSPITMTDAASITRTIAVPSSDRDSSPDLSSEVETFYSLMTWSNYSEGSVSTPGRSGGYPFVASASHERSLRNSFDSSVVPSNHNDLATASAVTLDSSSCSIQANISRSTDDITVTGESSFQVEGLANQLSRCIRNLAQIIAEARRINPAQVNVNEGDNYFGPIYNSGGFVGGRNNFNNLNNAANGLVELQYAFDRITAQRTTQSQL